LANVGSPDTDLTNFQQLDRRRLVLTMLGVMLALFLAALDQTIVSTALPRIVGELGGLERLSWVVSAYLVTSTSLMPAIGRLSDLYGRKWLYIVGIGIFLLGSILSGLSQSMLQLILFRALQGVGAAFIFANSIAIIGDVFPPKDRGKWTGIISAVFGLASIVGPLLGGWFTDNLSWRWVFYINMPVGALAALVLLIYMPLIRDRSLKPRIDYIGVALLTASVVCLVMALSLADVTYPWVSFQIIGLLVTFGVLLSLFILVESRAPEPVLPFTLFKSAIFNVSAVANVFIGIGMFGTILFLPMFIQGVVGRSATNSGILMLPMMGGAMFGSIVGGQLLARWSHYRILALVSLAIMSAGIFLFSRMDISTSMAVVSRNMAITGVGMGGTMPLYPIVSQNAFPQAMVGVVSAMVQFFRNIGGAIGVSVMGSLMASRWSRAFLQELPDQVEAGLGDRLESVASPSILTSPQAQAAVRDQLVQLPGGDAIFTQLFEAMRVALAVAIQNVFFIGFFLVLIAFVATLFLKEIPLRKRNVMGPTEEAVPEGTVHTAPDPAVGED
jgi:EmrB/QacA subfamily drug resistance transporter